MNRFYNKVIEGNVLSPTKKWFSQVQFRNFFFHDLGHSSEQFDTKNGLLWKMSGFFIFCVDFYWTDRQQE